MDTKERIDEGVTENPLSVDGLSQGTGDSWCLEMVVLWCDLVRRKR